MAAATIGHASYSSKGPGLIDYVAKPDLVAPGNLIVSLLSSPTSALATALPGNMISTSYYNSQEKATTRSSVYFLCSVAPVWLLEW